MKAAFSIITEQIRNKILKASQVTLKKEFKILSVRYSGFFIDYFLFKKDGLKKKMLPL